MEIRFPNGQIWQGTDEGMGDVFSISESFGAHACREHKTLFSFYSSWATGASDKVLFSFQNGQSDMPFIVDAFMINVDAATVLTLGRKTSGTPAGTAITGVNRYLGSGVAKSYTCYGNAEVTGSVAGDTLATLRFASASSSMVDINGRIVIPNGECLFVQSSASATVNFTLVGFWHE